MKIEDIKIKDFHQARWNEPIIMEMSTPGERGVLVPKAEDDIVEEVGDGVSALGDMLRKEPPALPEISQPRLMRHYIRISQENFGANHTLKLVDGTCTMKYNPVVNEVVASHPGILKVHPEQDIGTQQGILEVQYKMEEILKEISGLDKFSFQPGAGGQAVFSNASVIRAYHKHRGDHKRTEVITTIHAHPSNASTNALAGFKIITLMPGKDGLPDFEEFKAALSDRTAAFFYTNPEDTGIYNPRIKEFTDAVHEVGGLCSYDQANANALLGIARAKEAGFDLCHFNLHKTFGVPHGGFGPGCGAQGVREFLAPFLPKPTVEYSGKEYYYDYDRPLSIGKVRSYQGNMQAVLKAYLWSMSLGADGLKEASVISVLNNQYLVKKIMENVPGVTLWYDQGQRRMEQTRFSFDKLKEETGFGISDVNRRIVDYGIPELWESHHPLTVEEPFTPEPSENYSKEDLDYFTAVLRRVVKECYEDPEVIKTAPHNAANHQALNPAAENFEDIASTYRQYVKKFKNRGK